MSLPPELELVLNLCLLPLTEREQANALRLARQVNNWDEFVFWVQRHGVLGSVLGNLKTLPADLIPPAPRTRLVQAQRQASLRDMQLIAALAQVDKLFRSQEVDYLALKGPALSQLLFGAPFVRHSGDLDILVRTGEVARAEQLLLTEGYTPTLHKPPLTAMQFRRYMQYRHHFVYLQPGTGMQVELHWAIREPYIRQPAADEYFARAQNLILAGGLRLETLSNEDALLHAILHGASHRWNSAKHFRDLFALLSGQACDWARIRGIIAACRLEWPAAQGLQLGREFFQREIPAELGEYLQLTNRSIRFLKNAARNAFLAREAPGSPPAGRRLWYDTRLQAGPAYFFKTLAAAWLSPYYWLQVPLPDRFFPLYFAIVPGLAIWQKMVKPFAAKTWPPNAES